MNKTILHIENLHYICIFTNFMTLLSLNNKFARPILMFI
jgi:hypothetical protein